MLDETMNLAEATPHADFFFDKNAFHVRNSKFRCKNPNGKGIPKFKIQRSGSEECFCLAFELWILFEL
jgi:hypothetical protein